MAYIEESKGGWLVVWREDHDGKSRKTSRLVKWNTKGDGTGEDGEVTKADARATAEAQGEEERERARTASRWSG